jgi:hypothetical protein
MLRILFALFLAATPAHAETKPKAQAIEMPSDERILALVVSTLIALNQANATGNYSVFRELGAPGFQLINSTAKLANVFAELRGKGFDLAPIVFLTPKLIKRPELKDGILRVSGFFPTAPEQLNFDLMYQSVQGRWLLFGLAVDTSPVTPQGQAQGVPLPAQPEAKPESQVSEAPKEKPKPKPQAQSAPANDVRDRVHQLEAAAAQPPQPEKEQPKASFNPFAGF